MYHMITSNGSYNCQRKENNFIVSEKKTTFQTKCFFFSVYNIHVFLGVQAIQFIKAYCLQCSHVTS